MNRLNIGFIGLGLIGGSIAKALRASMPDIGIIVYDIDEKTRELAKSDGIASQTVSSIDASFSSCNYIFLCAPVSMNAENLAALTPFLSPSCILTDVGSVKSGIHERIEAALSGEGRIGSEQRTPVNRAAGSGQVFGKVATYGNTCPKAIQP